ncbi:reverse transcriptase [Anopheles sinensis]|uniref:Reverse transcriptase n=1 Tax=Anopheles sinensis TaxID=74873 RepID=A0A084W0U3_ANOSI|nr:reverse transcriptase [Anopheles sinensis]
MLMVSSLRLDHPKIPVHVDESVLCTQHHIRYLGIRFDNHLSCNFHVHAARETIQRRREVTEIQENRRRLERVHSR